MIPILITSSVYILDLITKVLVRSEMPVGQEIQIFPFFSLSHVKNTGVAFGLFQDKNVFFTFLGLLMVGGLSFISYKTYRSERFVSLVLAGVIGGALGNLTDRLYFGHVTDFLDFYLGSYHWPVFNVADSAICVGAFLLVLNNFRLRTKNQ